MDVVDTEKKKTIRDNINVSDKVTLTRALQTANKDNADPEIINLAETAKEINPELSKVEADPAPENCRPGSERLAVGFANRRRPSLPRHH